MGAVLENAPLHLQECRVLFRALPQRMERRSARRCELSDGGSVWLNHSKKLITIALRAKMMYNRNRTGGMAYGGKFG